MRSMRTERLAVQMRPSGGPRENYWLSQFGAGSSRDRERSEGAAVSAGDGKRPAIRIAATARPAPQEPDPTTTPESISRPLELNRDRGPGDRHCQTIPSPPSSVIAKPADRLANSITNPRRIALWVGAAIETSMPLNPASATAATRKMRLM